jgi:hypothetical protein
MKNLWILLYFTICWSFGAFAQNDKAVLRELLAEDTRAIEALVLYPESTRKIILETASHPEVLVRINTIQKKTQTKFLDLIASFSQEEQERFYDVARFPQLVQQLVVDERKTKAEIEAILVSYPENVHENALFLGRKRYEELQAVQILFETADQAFQAIVADYDGELKSQIEQLLEMPDVIDILVNNFQSTVLIGSIYERDPAWVWEMTDSIQAEVARNKTAELADWKATLQEDPAALQELEGAAQEFAEENGYNSKEYRRPISAADFSYQSGLSYQPYSYWLGYPSWYTHPIWYPRPYWYDWGFYYGPGGGLVLVDFPSWYFLDWYFSPAYHHYRYPHLTDRYLNHYERHPTSSLSSTSRIRNWTDENRNGSSREWLKNDQNRVERIRDFGRREASLPNRKTPDFRTPTYPRPTPSVRTQPIPPDRRTPLINRAPEYHNEQLKRETPVRVRPTVPARVPATIKRVPPSRPPSPTPIKRKRED